MFKASVFILLAANLVATIFNTIKIQTMAKTEQDFQDLAAQGKEQRELSAAENARLTGEIERLKSELQTAINEDGGLSAEAEQRVYSLFEEALSLQPVSETPADGENTDAAEDTAVDA